MNGTIKSFPMNEAQKADLAEKNMNLVWYMAHKFKGTGFDLEELYSAALMGMAVALNRFDPMRETRFSTFAACCMESQILMLLRKERNQRRIRTVSFDDRIRTTSDLVYTDVLKATDDTENDVISRQMMKETLEALSDREKDMLLLDSDGMRQVDIAARYGISQSLVSRIVKAARLKAKNHYYGGGQGQQC